MDGQRDEARVRVAAPSTTTRREVGRLAELAWPIVLAQLGTMLLGVVDVVMVGRLGEGPLAAVSLGHTVAFSLQFLLLGAAAGLDPLFAQAFGAGHPERAGQALVRGGAMMLVLALPLMALHLLAGPVLALAGEPEAIVDDAHVYAVIRALAVVPFAALMLLRQLLQAAGRMWPGFVAIVAGNLVNVVVNGCLLFGWLGAPRLGPAGAAWATVASTTAMAVVVALAVVPLWGALEPRLAALRDLPSFGRLAAVSLPVAFQVGLEGWGFSLSTIFAGWFGETALAAHTVALTVASLAFMVPLGLSSAASARVGNLVGAGHPWQRAGWVSVGLGAGAMLVSAAGFLVAPVSLAALFVAEPAAVLLAASLLPIAAGFALFDGTQVVAFGVLRGAGDTAVPAVANIVGYYLIGLPAGLALAYGAGLGVRGLWVGLLIALGCVAALLLVRLRWLGWRGVRRVG